MEKSNITLVKTIASLHHNLLIDTFSSKNDIRDLFLSLLFIRCQTALCELVDKHAETH